MVGFTFAPSGWAMCNGQLLPINQNQALFALLGTTYGGNGVTTFALPDLRGRVAIHLGAGPGLSDYVQGQTGGVEATALTLNNLPNHNHPLNCIPAGGNQASPANASPAIESTGTSMNYAAGSPSAQMNPAAIGPAGGGQPVSLLQPYLCVNFIIALQGIFPSRN